MTYETVNVRCSSVATKCHATCVQPSGVVVRPNVPGSPADPTAALAPGAYAEPSSTTETSEIDSPASAGMSRYAPWYVPSNANVRRSVTCTDPSGATRNVSSAAATW